MRSRLLMPRLGVALTFLCVNACSDSGTGVPRRGAYPIIKPDGSGDFATIQDAVDHVASGDTIFLSNGRFAGSGNRDIELRGLDIVIRSLNGTADDCVIDCGGSQTDLHRGFWFHMDEGAASVIESITIERGFVLGGGAAVLCENGSSPTFKNVYFRDNGKTAVTLFSGSSLLEGCLFERNLDGGLSCSDGASVELRNCDFNDNYVEGGGAAVVSSSSFVSLLDCNFHRNSSTFAGGAILSDVVSSEDSASVRVDGCTFIDNVAGYYGGALRCSQTGLEIQRCTFIGNTAGNSGGALDLYFASSGNISSCTFYSNSAPSGSALRLALGSWLNLTSSIVAFNTEGEAVFCDTLSAASQPNIRCSDVFGNGGGDWTGCIAAELDSTGNISADPIFCNKLVGDLRLDESSPCRQDVLCGTMGASSMTCNNLALINRLFPQNHLQDYQRKPSRQSMPRQAQLVSKRWP